MVARNNYQSGPVRSPISMSQKTTLVGETKCVLVAGAGPVGLTAALMLAEQGIIPVVINSAGGRAKHSYACALHPASLELLDQFDLLGEILSWGYRIDSVGFYEGRVRKAEVSLSKISAKFPFVVALPQNALEHLLEKTLAKFFGIEVGWRLRLAGIGSNNGSVAVQIEELPARSAKGGPELGHNPIATTELEFPFLIGADGRHSIARQSLGIPNCHFGEPEHYAIFEFDIDHCPGHEARVVIDPSGTNVLWPISDHRCRWSFQIASRDQPGIPRSKHENHPDHGYYANGNLTKELLRELIDEKAPWFTNTIRELHWKTKADFQRSLAERCAVGRCCLIGDAVHQAWGPSERRALTSVWANPRNLQKA